MADKLIYRGSDNQIKDLPAAQPGQFLISDRLGMAWKALTASAIPFADPTHFGLANVEAALIRTLKALYDLSDEVDAAQLNEIKASFAKMNKMLAGMQTAIDQLTETVSVLGATGEADEPASRSATTALHHKRKALVQRLGEPGSYTNQATTATSIHAALDELYRLLTISDAQRNLLTRDQFGALYAEALKVTNQASVHPVTFDDDVLNIAPAQVAHIRKPEGVKIEVTGDTWLLLEHDLLDVVYDSLAPTGTGLVTQSAITVQRDGYYLAETFTDDPNVIVSVVVNGKQLDRNVWRGRLNEGDQVAVVLWSNHDSEVDSEISLFVQLIA